MQKSPEGEIKQINNKKAFTYSFRVLLVKTFTCFKISHRRRKYRRGVLQNLVRGAWGLPRRN